jgi:C-terminal processing protease CtpA/Prc
MFTSILKVAAVATALFSSASPALVTVANARSHHQAVSSKTALQSPKLNCDDSFKGPFNSYLEYSCGYLGFREHSSVLTYPSKMKEFEKLWDPSIWAQSPELKMTGVSESNRKKLTYALLKRMRDFTHERFDYVNDPEDVAIEEKSDVHPVLTGGIGVEFKLENAWMIDQSIVRAAAPGTLTSDEFIARKNELSVISPTYRLIVGATSQESPSDGVLQNNDIIVAVDGVAVEGMAFNDAVEHHLDGTTGTSVSLDVLRKNPSDPQGEMQSLHFHLVRSDFDERAVSVEDIDGVRHITVDNFENKHLLADFHRALAEAKAQHLKGVDVNLRDNPGGRLDYVLGMLEMVVPQGLLLSTREREEGATSLLQTDYTMLGIYGVTVKHNKSMPSIVYYTRVAFSTEYEKAARDDFGYVYKHPLLPVIDGDMPVVVSQNGESYSASEVFAGAIQATHRGAIVGKPSAGKGAIMVQITLPQGGQLEVTDGQFYPGGVDTKYIGILPDYDVDLAHDYGQTDAQQDKAGAVIEEAYKRLQAFKVEATAQVKINGDRFEQEMKERDAEDNKPVSIEDVSAK